MKTEWIGRKTYRTRNHAKADVFDYIERFYNMTRRHSTSNDLRGRIAIMDAEAVIPSRRNRKVVVPHDPYVYKHRNQVERCSSRLEHFRRFATRYERRTVHFTGFVFLAAAVIWLR